MVSCQAAATILWPSAEQATATHPFAGALVWTHVWPRKLPAPPARRAMPTATVEMLKAVSCIESDRDPFESD